VRPRARTAPRALRSEDSVDVEVRAALFDRATLQRNQPGQCLETHAQARDLGEDALGAADHLAIGHVVLRPMPGAHQAAVLVDAAAGEVGTQVAALATHSEVFAVVADGVLSDSGDGALGNARSWDGMAHQAP